MLNHPSLGATFMLYSIWPDALALGLLHDQDGLPTFSGRGLLLGLSIAILLVIIPCDLIITIFGEQSIVQPYSGCQIFSKYNFYRDTLVVLRTASDTRLASRAEVDVREIVFINLPLLVHARISEWPLWLILLILCHVINLIRFDKPIMGFLPTP